MDLNNDNIKKIRGLILFTAIILVAAWNYKAVFSGIRFLGNVIAPFVLGCAIAFVLNVPMKFLEDKIFGKAKNEKKKWALKLARPLSFIITLLFVVGVIGIVLLVVIPELGRTIMNLGKTLQDFVPKVQAYAVDLFQENKQIATWIQGIEFNWDQILNSGIEFLKNGAGNVLGSTVEVALNVVSGMATFFIAFVFSCYVLLQKEKLNVQVRKLMTAFMPEDWKNILLALASVTYKTFSNFLTGQCTEAIILGGMFFIVMTIMNMPYALLISVLIAFTALIPLVGAFIGCGVGAFLIFMIDPTKALIFIIVFLVLQQIEGNFIYPYVVGNSVGLPSIWVLVAVTLGGSLFGLGGMLVFIPLVSVIYTILRGVVNRRLGLKK